MASQPTHPWGRRAPEPARRRPRGRLALASLVSLVSWASLVSLSVALPARAEPATEARAEPVTEALGGATRDAIESDSTIVPDGYGAIFVPDLDPLPESDASVIVEVEGETLAVGRLGRRVPVPPGRYHLFIGAGPKEQRAHADVEVVAGQTATVTPSYGVLRVAIVDSEGRPSPLTFVVGAIGDGAHAHAITSVHGPFRPSFKPGQRASVGLTLPEGRYVLALGDDPKARDGAVALVVARGQVLQYRVVVEDGRLVRTEFGEGDVLVEPSIYRLRWTLAADGTLGSKQNQLSSYNGDALTLGAYSRLELGIDTGRHLAELSVFTDLAAVGILSSNGSSELPLQKVTDDVRAEVLYNYRLGGVAGPYARLAGTTSLFPTRFYAPDTMHAVTRREDGTIARDETFAPGEAYRLFPELGPLILQEAAGVGTKLEFEMFRFALRGGLAARQAYFFDGRTVTRRAGRELELLTLSDVKTVGMEATVMAGVTLRNVLDLDTRLDGFLGEDQFGALFNEQGTYRPVYRWDTSASARLSRHVALVYTLGLRRDTPALQEAQLSHSLRLRLQWSIF